MSDEGSKTTPSQAAFEMTETSMADSISMMMQNATNSQKAMQTMTNSAVSLGVSLILSKGAGGG